ncbi:DUF4268 domain-containing protein [Massilia sp. Dwa41.01b]|uniref:DUF4268 domain-containing protein n=1 Tax=unclassified Massilia TaxID=2609279 RepID=UPI0015FFB0F6|nr:MULTISPECIES: DUF4268 domain-containing protein [unclassified Massilia]QNA89781.1 DUF4268 domain-containing protein [Massilia sp. Dwa41.01b]QNB00675.1 DUF4268 domain-containing protein [Massilia sp. Se16.2.3]
MAIFELDNQRLAPLAEADFHAEGIYERELQHHLRHSIGILSPDLMVVAEEYGNWVDSQRRIDLLCLDKEANLVVVEIKRTRDGGHMDLQAIRYAAMVSAMTFEQLVDGHAHYLRANGHPADAARAAILQFLDWTEADEEAFAQDVHIVLAGPDFSREVTSTALWLNERKLNIRCIRMKPYRSADGRLFIDIQQIIPLPESSDYQTKIRAKEQAEREQRSERLGNREHFFAGLLDYVKPRMGLFASKRAAHGRGFNANAGKPGLLFGFLDKGDRIVIELEISHSEERVRALRTLFWKDADAIETAFGESLHWDEVDGRRAVFIRHYVDASWKAAESEWQQIYATLTEDAIRMQRALQQTIDAA